MDYSGELTCMKKVRSFLNKIFVHYKFFVNKSFLKKKKIWWRDDDSFDLNEKFIKLLEFKKNNKSLNVYLSIIPGKLRDNFIKRVNEIEKLYVLPHGYLHKNYSKNNVYLNEYPKERDIDQIDDEISFSISKLKMQFPNKYLPIFVPPWEHFSKKILPILNRNGVKYISMSGNKEINGDFRCINGDINFHNYKNFEDGQYKVIHKSLLTLSVEIINSLRKKNNHLIGFMTHHKDMSHEDWDNYNFLLKTLSRYGCVPSNHKYFMEKINGKK